MRPLNIYEIEAMQADPEDHGNGLIFDLDLCKHFGHKMANVSNDVYKRPNLCPRCESAEYTRRLMPDDKAKCLQCGTEYEASYSYETVNGCTRLGCKETEHIKDL